MKICLVGSSGGHLDQLYLLKDWWRHQERFWVTFPKEDARHLLKDEKCYWCHYPTNRNFKNLFKNTLLAWKILFKERPDLIISTGAAPAIPFFYLGKLLGSRLIFIEDFARIDFPTITGRVVYPVADRFLIQWPEQKKSYPKGIYLGGIL